MKKKPVLIKRTARLFPEKESEAATATSVTSEGRITEPLSYDPFKGREVLFTRLSNKDINPYRSGIETRGKASETP